MSLTRTTPATILIRHARSYSVHFRNSPFEQVKHYGLGQSEMFNPRTWSHVGNGRMGKPFKQYPKPRTSPERPYKIFGPPSWPKAASRRANANCLRPKAEFSRASGRGLRRVRNYIVAPCLAQGDSDPQGSCYSNRSLSPRG